MIYRFFPAEFKRQYVVARNFTDALSKEQECFSEFCDECVFYGYPPEEIMPADDWQWDSVIEAYLSYTVRFRAMTAHQTTFIDTHY